MRVSSTTYYCHKCKNGFDIEVKMGRRDECPHCAADLHVCKNCKYWDPSSHNECKEHISEYIPDREKANFCGMFTYREGPYANEPDLMSAKAKLDALFKK